MVVTTVAIALLSFQSFAQDNLLAMNTKETPVISLDGGSYHKPVMNVLKNPAAIKPNGMVSKNKSNGTSIVIDLMQQSGSEKAFLEEAILNSDTHHAFIRFHIPENSGKAQIAVSNQKGQLVEMIDFSNNATATFRTLTLASGIYTYTLYVDGKQVESKNISFEK